MINILVFIIIILKIIPQIFFNPWQYKNIYGERKLKSIYFNEDKWFELLNILGNNSVC